MKRLFAALLVCILFISFCPAVYAQQSHQTGSVQLKTLGNKLVFADDESVEVHLTGVNTCGSEWTGAPDKEHIKRSVRELFYNWDANLIRLGVSLDGWWGRYSYMFDGGESYRNYITEVINMINDSGKYVILDLHHYKYLSQEYAQFWREAADLYGNNPAVLFGLLNEPSGNTTWETWRNGDGGDNFGLQPLVEMIRDMGAKNILVAGGINYSGTLAQIGVEGGYDLIDQGSDGDKTKTGYGIMYDAHIYPAHGQTQKWDSKFGQARKKYPVLIGEFGWDINGEVVMGNATDPENSNYHTKWFPEMLDWIEDDITYGAKANWTAWCFHPISGPRMLEEYDDNGTRFYDDGYIYTPTEWFGAYIKGWLSNELSENIALNKKIISSTNGRIEDSTDAAFALDGDKTTSWKCANSAEKELVIDLGAEYNINRWIVYHKNTLHSYSLMTSLDGEDWVTTDSYISEDAEVSDKYFKTTPCRYVKLHIDESNAVSEIYELKIIADNKNDGIINIPDSSVSGGAVLNETCYDFYNGTMLHCWWSSGHTPEYINAGAQDGKGKALHFEDAADRMMAFQKLSNTSGFSYFEYKYKSTYDVSVYFQLDYRASDRETLTTNTFVLPSTDGEWSTFRVTPEMLMPGPEDTWVKTDLATGWSAAANNFEPILLSYMNTKTTGYADFEYFKAVWTMGGLFNYQSVRILQNGLECETLKAGKADFYLRYNNQESQNFIGILAVVAIYNADGTLVSMSALPFNAGIKVRTREHKLTVDIPCDGCTAKIITWRTAEGMEPVTDVIEF